MIVIAITIHGWFGARVVTCLGGLCGFCCGDMYGGLGLF